MPAKAHAPVVLLLHGNGGCRRSSVDKSRFYSELGYATMMISLRAHGDSTGDVNDIGFSAKYDVKAAVDWLVARDPDALIVIDGESLGSSAAIFAVPLMPRQVRSYILESPFRDLKTAVWNRTERYLPWPLDRVAYAGLVTMAPMVLPDAAKIRPVDAVSAIPAIIPVLILSGDSDQNARPAEAREIQARIASHSRLVMFPGAAHVSLAAFDPILYRRSVLEFLKSLQAP